MSRVPIAILASGRGSNFNSILNEIRSGHLDAEIVALVSDNPKAMALEKARQAGIYTIVVPAEFDGKDAKLPLNERRCLHERKILDALTARAPRFLVMAGYLRIISSCLINAFASERGYSRIVNIHPSLLPAFPGLNSYARAFSFGARVTGVTVHLAEEKVDNGPICAQEAFSISDCRTAAEVEERGLAVEHRLYPQTLRWVLLEQFDIEVRASISDSLTASPRRMCVRPN